MIVVLRWMTKMEKNVVRVADKGEWEPFKFVYKGALSEIVLQGVGKLSPSPTDPGEPRKVRPME